MKLTERPQWHGLQKLYNHLASQKNNAPCQNTFSSSPIKIEALHFNYFYPYSTELIKQITETLIDLAINCDLSAHVEDLFTGKPINITENRPALHTTLRELEHKNRDIIDCLQQMRDISEKIRTKTWLGYTGKPIQSIVHIGIGGSELSQRLTCYALEQYAASGIDIHFVANIDPVEMDSVLKKLNPETTLVIVASKSFSTKETEMNMDKAIAWLKDSRAIQTQVLIITAHPEKFLQHYGISPAGVLSIWDGVDGRYSIWSAMGLILMITIGYENFIDFLKGAFAMDQHFRTAPFNENIPVMLGLLGIWNINFLQCQTHAIIPYCQRLLYLPQHLQQLEMESNGKSLTTQAMQVNYATGPIIWGGIGCNSQHSFHQLLHQGTHRTPIDFIMVKPLTPELHTNWLNANCEAQIKVLSKNPNTLIHLITLDNLSPYSLGMLIAMYEHKVFVQSRIWDINPFDQPGVEEGKILAQSIMLAH